MTPNDYHALPAVSAHGLSALLDSPAACYRRYLDPQRVPEEPTAALRLGTLVHALALTPRQVEHTFVVADYERRSKAGKARYAALTASGLTAIKPGEWALATTLAAALLAHPEARKLLRGGQKERSIVQPRAAGLLPLKGRLDLHHESRRLVVELKTTHALAALPAAIDRYRYLLAAAFYQHLVKAAGVIVIAVQTTPPHDVAVLPLDRLQLQAGHEQWRTALAQFDDCWTSGEWPDTPLNPLPPLPPFGSPRREWPVGELTL